MTCTLINLKLHKIFNILSIDFTSDIGGKNFLFKFYIKHTFLPLDVPQKIKPYNINCILFEIPLFCQV